MVGPQEKCHGQHQCYFSKFGGEPVIAKHMPILALMNNYLNRSAPRRRKIAKDLPDLFRPVCE